MSAGQKRAGSIKSFVLDVVSLLRWRALKRTFYEVQKDDVLGLAAQLAFYLTLALFPFLLGLVSLMGTFSSEELATNLLAYFRRVLPPPVYDVLSTYTENVLSGRNPAPELLSFGILGTLWATSNAFFALIKALNQAYDVRETRPLWKTRGLAILMSLGLSGLVLIGVVLLVVGPHLGTTVAEVFGLGDEFEFVWDLVRWPTALLFLVITVALMYYFAPDVEQPFRWITPGGLIAVILWVLASVGFSFYLGNLAEGTYDRIYGSIGVFIILLLYLYISSLTILLGAELNAVLTRMKEEVSGERIIEGEPAKVEAIREDEEGA
jgi:membrane protein